MFGEYAGFIIPAYIITAILLVGLTGFVWLTYLARKRELKALEEAGISRRSTENS